MLKLVVSVSLLLVGTAWGHEHQAGETSEQARVIEFYRTWQRPKGDFNVTHRQNSCCYATGSNQDCFPVLAQRRNEKGIIEVTPDVTGAATGAQISYGGQWYALDHHINEDEQPDPRESPDGRSHVCIAPAQIAICYVAGYGN